MQKAKKMHIKGKNTEIVQFSKKDVRMHHFQVIL
jgi:hypothetical protein